MQGVSAGPEAGELIAGKYYLQYPLGSGGMGAVYAAIHNGTGRKFAIKLLNPQLAGDEEAETRFFREAMLASAINHPAIVEVYDVGRHGAAPYMVMKLLEGESLGDRIMRGALPVDEAIALLLPVLDGVSAAHARGILHRDLKPDNILLVRADSGVQPKILDFGISKLLGADAETRLTQTGISIGTPLYMSPEQVRGEPNVDARADVYALGVILYEMVTGTVPYQGNNFADLVVNIVAGAAPSARSYNPTVHVALDAVIARAMARDAEHRYPSAAALAADLRTYRSLRPEATAPPAPGTSTPSPSHVNTGPNTPLATPAHGAMRRRTSSAWAWAIASVAASLLAYAASWLWLGLGDAAAPPTAAAPPRARPVSTTPAAAAALEPTAQPPATATPPPAADSAPSADGTAPSRPRPSARRPRESTRTRETPRRGAAAPVQPASTPSTPPAKEPKHWRVPNEIIDPFEDPG